MAVLEERTYVVAEWGSTRDWPEAPQDELTGGLRSSNIVYPETTLES